MAPRRKKAKAKAETSFHRSARLARKSASPSKQLNKVTDPGNFNPPEPIRKRQRKAAAIPAVEARQDRRVPSVNHWLASGAWPKEYFEPTADTIASEASSPYLRLESLETDSMGQSLSTIEMFIRNTTKTYEDPFYPENLEKKGSYMEDSELGIMEDSREICKLLLEEEQLIPRGTLFDDDVFNATIKAVRGRSEARIARDIMPLLVPSAENLSIHGATGLATVIEGLNEGWNKSCPLFSPRPQPDFAVGLGRGTFTDEQLEKLSPGIISGERSLFMATTTMCFPFLTCEVPGNSQGLDIADRQNAHSMTLAVRANVELFKLANRQQELHRTVLAFSVSHDNSTVKIYGHYPVIEGSKVSYYCHLLYAAVFTA